MKKDTNRKRIIFTIVFVFPLMIQSSWVYADKQACLDAGGTVMPLTECDGSTYDWCIISEKEQCYVDQVKDGRCTEGRYDETLGGIVGITPKVLCDDAQ